MITGESRWKQPGDEPLTAFKRIEAQEDMDGAQIITLLDACERLGLDGLEVLNVLRSVWGSPAEDRLKLFSDQDTARPFSAARALVQKILKAHS